MNKHFHFSVHSIKTSLYSAPPAPASAGNDIGAIVGGAVGGLLAVLIVIILVVLVMWCVIVKRSTKSSGQKEPQEDKRVGPVYEEVGSTLPPREMDIELQSNQAYGQVTRVHVS